MVKVPPVNSSGRSLPSLACGGAGGAGGWAGRAAIPACRALLGNLSAGLLLA